ncbi:MAG: glycoside hydrolase family 18 protein [Candidatus Gracilibacteria bacterium]
MFKIIQRLARTVISITAISFTVLFCLTAWFLYGFHLESRAVEPRIAFWLGHSFATTNADFESLNKNISPLPVTDLYFHVGPLTEAGGLADDISIDTLAMEALTTQNFAWIGALRSQIDLANPLVRSQIIASAKWTLTQGFDGIHLDIEPIHADDEDFFTLLKELNEQIPGVKISVAMDEWQPSFLTKKIAQIYNTKIESYWTSDQVKRTADFVDQIVVMTYDTGFHDPKLYEWWVETQTIALSKIIPDGVEFFVGIPAYKTGANFDKDTENLSTGIAGFTRAVQNIRSNIKNIDGIAIYPYWEMTDLDFETLSQNYNALGNLFT